MNRETQAAVLLFTGLVIGRLTLDGGYQSYVKTGLYWPLMLSAGLLIVVGAISVLRRADRSGPSGLAEETDDSALADGHAETMHGAGGPAVGLLMLIPIAVLVLVAPAPLGAFAAERATANRTAEQPAAYQAPPLPEPVDGAVDLTLGEILVRAYYDQSGTLEGTPVRLTGFVVPSDRADGGYLLTRFVVGCCAADALPLQVLVMGADEVPARDTWVEVTAVWEGEIVEDDRVELPVLALTSQRVVDEPEQPYEY